MEASLQDASGASPLHYVTWRRPWTANLIHDLVRKGCDVRLRNADGLTARDLARSHGDRESERLLSEIEADGSAPTPFEQPISQESAKPFGAS